MEKLTVKDLIERLKTIDPNLPVSLLVEYHCQYEDFLYELIVTDNRVILTGIQRLD